MHAHRNAVRAAIIAVFSFVSLAGCAPKTGSNFSYASIVGVAQTDYPQVKAIATAACAAGRANAQDCTLIAKIETDADPVFAALSTTTSPTTLAAGLNDVSAIISALPNTLVSTQTKSDVALAVTAIELIANAQALL